MKRCSLLFLIIIATLLSSWGISPTDSILAELDHTIERRDVFYTMRQHSIDSLKRGLPEIINHFGNVSPQHLAHVHKIFNLYGPYQSDSALYYAQSELDLARKLGNQNQIVEANCDLLYAYMAAGLFTDAQKLVEHVDLSQVSDSLRGMFYFPCIRLFSDLSNFYDNTFSDENARLSLAYSDSVMALLPPESYEAEYAAIFTRYNYVTVDEKIARFENIMARRDVDIGEKAMIASMLGDYYREKGLRDSMLHFKALSSIMDVRAGKRETTSKLHLALEMYQRGDIERANRYIHIALEDANYYNTRHRKTEICNILPLIEDARYTTVDNQRATLGWVVVVISALLLALIVAIFYIVRQMKRLHAAKRSIEVQNAEIEKRNADIQSQNQQLQELNNAQCKLNSELSELNTALRESNKIKDEYLGYCFAQSSGYIAKIEDLHKLVNRKLAAHQYDDLRLTLRERDLRLEKENMHADFDRIFMRLFPSFVEKFNALFEPEYQVDPAIKELTTEMRIFALIRLGITDSAKIAQFLNYSVNTVNTYKTKTKNRSLVPNDQFEARIMEIRSVS